MFLRIKDNNNSKHLREMLNKINNLSIIEIFIQRLFDFKLQQLTFVYQYNL